MSSIGELKQEEGELLVEDPNLTAADKKSHVTST